MRSLKFLCCVLLAAAPAVAGPPMQLQPAGPWVLDYGEDSCRLLRNFGEGKTQATIAFELASPRSPISLLVLGSAVAVDDDARDVTGEFRPLPRSTFKNGNAVKSVANNHDAILWSHINLLDPALFPEITERKDPTHRDLISLFQKKDAVLQNLALRAAQVQSIAIAPKRGRALNLNTGPLAEAFKMMNQCSRDELSSWGIDPKVDDKIVMPARPINLTAWFRSEDYPREAISKGIESSMQFRVNVDATGQVTDCHIITPVQAPEINDKICAIMRKRARFTPALLADGTRVPDYFTSTIVFRIAG